VKFQDYYSLLGVARDATPEDIKKAFRKLAMQWHPDRHPEKERPAAEARFKQISEAYEVLSDPQKRKRYDQLGSRWQHQQDMGSQGADFGGGGFRTMDPDEFSRMFGGGFSDFFARFFGDDMRRDFEARAGRERRAARRGADVEATLEISVDDVVLGGGRSQFSIEATGACPRCDGAGFVEEHVCPTCAGMGTVRAPRSVDLRIPEDVHDGQALRLRGLGAAGAGGAEPGDLRLTLRLKGGELYRLRGHDVEADVPVAPWEALDGGEVEVRTPRGRARVRVPPGSKAGDRLRLRGQGLTGADGQPTDFQIVLRLALPASLTPRQRSLIQEAGAAGPAAVQGGARIDADAARSRT
jgi:DnaJ-class molecular chaperone